MLNGDNMVGKRRSSEMDTTLVPDHSQPLPIAHPSPVLIIPDDEVI